MVKGTPDVLEETVQTVCPAVVQWLKGEKVDKSEQLTKIFDDVSVSRSLSNVNTCMCMFTIELYT